MENANIISVHVFLLCTFLAFGSSDMGMPFGTGMSAWTLTTEELEIFNYTVSNDGTYGVMTHFWVTGPNGYPSVDEAIFRYYIDGEDTASIEFTPSFVCGVGFDDDQAPWGTAWFGKGSASGGWFHNFRIPFQKSIHITAFHPMGKMGGFYTVVRGVENMPIVIGGVTLPPTARVQQFTVINQTVNPLEYVPLVDLKEGDGIFFMSTLSVQSGNLNFLEGCFHAYTPYTTLFPGLLISTGTEDYYNSGWYFSAGQFHMPTTGFTHLNTTKNGVTWSAYRFHDMDTLPFHGGFRFVWRNGDAVDPVTGHKCFTETGGNVVGQPTQSNVSYYAWVYLF
jgi:hypothetical protein